ncbi:Homoserine dehydrogenase [Lachnospiraceae bacterium TWA4]|nr:Homoserine dehydrogenase [Lachnospiraceae bacterium TWA4]
MIKIAVMGYGTIGSGVSKTLEMNKEIITNNVGEEVSLKYVLDLRDFPGDPIEDKVVHDVNVIANDPEVSIVVETMGGTKPAYEFVKMMLESGKSVVTSNKALVAAHGTELLEIAASKKKNFLFGASVGGGIPIIRPLRTSLAQDELQEITGILNGTTNYILTKMKDEGLSYEVALSQAQALGYAEKDPTADVEGYDSCRKIAILSSLAYEKEANYEDIHTEGITKITNIDFQYANKAGMAVKLLATSRRVGDKFYAVVAPTMVDATCPLYSVSDVFNAVLVKGNIVGDLMFYGSGAGSLPTAAAVVADVIEVAKHPHCSVMRIWSREKLEFSDYKELESRFFVRFEGKSNKNAVIELLEPTKAYELEGMDEYGVVTKKMSQNAFEEALKKLDGVISVLRVH